VATDEPPRGPLVMLAALSREVRPFLRLVRARRQVRGCWEWRRGRQRGVLCLAGPGEEAAAGAARELLRSHGPAALFSVGFAGALTEAVAPGDVVVGAGLWRYRPEAGAPAALAGHSWALEASALVTRLRQAGLPAHAGSLVTAPVIVRKAQEGLALHHLPCPVLDQESAAVAEAARDAGVPFLGLRTVTDGAGEEIPRFLAELLEAGVEPGWGQALVWVAASPRRAVVLHHFWRRAVLAARRLARALEIACEMIG